jgi:hypothetical protein
VLFVTAALVANGCSRLASLAAPSPLWHKVLPEWSPYVVLSSDDGALGGYRDALTSLTGRGAISGVRIGLSADGSATPTVNLAASYGLDIIGIVDDSDLFAQDVEGVFDRYRAAYPLVKTFQIGNEITTFGGRPMTIDQYVGVFGRVYSHAVGAYPDVTLVAQATFGSGTIGSTDLSAEAAAFTARRLSTSRVVLALNVYSETALAAYATVMPDVAPGYRIWVTETGVADPASQIMHVTLKYPQLRTLLRAERIYWYALWAGDAGGDSGFSLISGATHPPIVPGPLFHLLTDG